MHIGNFTVDQANYKPSFIYATATSPGGFIPEDSQMTAAELVERHIGRTTFSQIPIELHVEHRNALKNGNTARAEKLGTSINNIIASALLKMQEEAEEGTLLLKKVQEKLAQFDNPIPNYTPAYIPTPTTPIIKMQLEGDTPKVWLETPCDELEDGEEYNNAQILTQQAKMTMMASWLRQAEILSEIDESIMNLGVN